MKMENRLYPEESVDLSVAEIPKTQSKHIRSIVCKLNADRPH